MNNSVFMTKRQSLKNLSEVMAVKIYMYGYRFENNNNMVYTFLISLNYMTFMTISNYASFPFSMTLSIAFKFKNFLN